MGDYNNLLAGEFNKELYRIDRVSRDIVFCKNYLLSDSARLLERVIHEMKDELEKRARELSAEKDLK